MTERRELLDSIAATTADYRSGEIAAPTPEHVDRWVRQFASNVQVPLLRELDHVLKQTYYSKTQVSAFLDGLVNSNTLAGLSPCEFWKKAHFLRIQQNGHSQEDLLGILDGILKKECGVTTDECGANDGDFVYIDDAMFSGGRVGDDLEVWIREDAPAQAVVHVIVIATHTFAEYKMPQQTKQGAAAHKKMVTLHVWRSVAYENKLANRNTSEVLWPTELPEDEELRAYMAEEQRFPFVPRQRGGRTEHDIFSSEQGRKLLERELLLAGMRIRSYCQNPRRALRPLGFSPFGLGFGSLIVSFRNCPNNCPLAFWWGDPEADRSHPFSNWYPLFPRKTYAEEADFDVIGF